MRQMDTSRSELGLLSAPRTALRRAADPEAAVLPNAVAVDEAPFDVRLRRLSELEFFEVEDEVEDEEEDERGGGEDCRAVIAADRGDWCACVERSPAPRFDRALCLAMSPALRRSASASACAPSFHTGLRALLPGVDEGDPKAEAEVDVDAEAEADVEESVVAEPNEAQEAARGLRPFCARRGLGGLPPCSSIKLLSSSGTGALRRGADFSRPKSTARDSGASSASLLLLSISPLSSPSLDEDEEGSAVVGGGSGCEEEGFSLFPRLLPPPPPPLIMADGRSGEGCPSDPDRDEALDLDAEDDEEEEEEVRSGGGGGTARRFGVESGSDGGEAKMGEKAGGA